MTRPPSYADLEIRILERQDEGYPVELTLDSEMELERGFLAADLLPWVATTSVAEDGERLFAALFADPVMKEGWAEIRGRSPQRRVRLRIDASAPELHALPWELLRDPGAGVSQDLAAAEATPFSRYLAGRWRPGIPILQRPIRVLVAIADPEDIEDYDLPRIAAEEHWQSLKQAMAGSEIAPALLPQPCTLTALQTELARGYHVLHFVGHGRYFEEETEDGIERQAVLYLADPNNRAAFVYDAELAEMLGRQLADTDARRDDKLRLVFLASCETAKRSTADAFRGLAPRLVAAGVPAVLAMQEVVREEAAEKFAAGFYRHLLEHGQVDLACNQARSLLLNVRYQDPSRPEKTRPDRTQAGIPALFMRLRSGELLGSRGRVSSDREDTFWPFLLGNIRDRACTPFLGPRLTSGLLPSPRAVAEKLAEEYGYPLPDRHLLPRVAQFMAVRDPKRLRADYLRLLRRRLVEYLGLDVTAELKRSLRGKGLAATAEAVGWAEKVLTVRENEPHHLLAELELPLYLTTNVDSLMSEALKHRGLAPRRLGPRWRQEEAGSPHWAISPQPSPEQPVVFHLNGFEGEEEQQKRLVLSEDDYLAHVVRLARDQTTLLPTDVLGELADSSYLFIGFQLDDWEFRALLQGLIRPIAQMDPEQRTHVGVQLEWQETTDPDKAREYLERYLGQFHIDIYWGTAGQFVSELYSRWQSFRVEEDAW